MGTFYTNVTLKGVAQADAAAYLNSQQREAFVSPEVNGCIVVYDEQSEEMEIDTLEDFTTAISKHFGCPALAVYVYNGDFLWYLLFDAGKLVDEYNSMPHYFDEDEPTPPQGGDGAQLCAIFGVDPALAPQLDYILRNEDAYTFAVERHEDLVRVLGLHPAAVDVGFDYIDADDLPKWVTLDVGTLVKAGLRA